MLKNPARSFLAAAFFSLFFIALPQADASEWFEGTAGYQSAVSQNKRTGKPVLLYFYTTWCPVCRRFDQGTFKDKQVAAYLEPFMKVRIDAEKEEELAYEYNVEAYPTFYVISRAGTKEVPRYSNPARFMEECSKAGLK
jgi:thiol-disulfide isomerase/thioredoxin